MNIQEQITIKKEELKELKNIINETIIESQLKYLQYVSRQEKLESEILILENIAKQTPEKKWIPLEGGWRKRINE